MSRGATLPIALMLLAAVSGLALVAATDGVLQARMVTNAGRGAGPESAARSALDWAEAWLMSRAASHRPEPCASACPTGTVIHSAGYYPDDLERLPDEWWQATAAKDGWDPETGTQSSVRPGADLPSGHWLVEELHFQAATEAGGPATGFYRVVARGSSIDGRQAAVFESRLARPWGVTAWSDPWPPVPGQARFCRDAAIDTPCGRLGWRRLR